MANTATHPVLTTVIPTYRRPHFLRRAVQSILNQTYPHFQIDVYDNASGDETPDVVHEFAAKDPRIRYHCHSENMGSLNNFNFGLTHVNTPYFSLFSDDDVLLPDFYESALKGFETHPDAVFSCTQVLEADLHGNVRDVLSSFWQNALYAPPEGLLTMLKSQPAWTGILFKKEVVEKTGILRDDVGLPVDLDYLFRIAARHPFVINLEKPCALHFPVASFNNDAVGINAMREEWRGAVKKSKGFSSEMTQWIDGKNTRFTYTHFWPGWLQIIRNITEDCGIPQPVRDAAKEKLMLNLQALLIVCGKMSLSRGNFHDVLEIEQILSSTFGKTEKASRLKTRALALSGLQGMQRVFPSLLNPPRWIYNAFLTYLRGKNLDSAYNEHYVPYVNSKAILAYVDSLHAGIT